MQKVAVSRFVLVFSLACSIVTAQDPVDLVTVHNIKTEAFEHSTVMDTASWLTDVYGPRLTASPEFQQAADWAADRMKTWGLSNVHLESWGPFGRAWSLKHYSVELIEPRYSLLDAMPLAWSTPTKKPVEGELVLAPYTAPQGFNQAKADEAFEAYKKEWTGKLKGKVVLYSNAAVNANNNAASLKRYTDADLTDLAKSPDPAARTGRNGADAPPTDPAAIEQLSAKREEAAAKRAQFFIDQGAVAILQVDARSHEGMAFAEAAGPYKMKGPLSIPQFRLTAEHYNRLVRLMEKKQTAKVRIDLQASVGDKDLSGQNIVAELPGTGPHKDEFVLIGAHFDSWHGGTGATDNAAGSAVMMEVMRILKVLNVKNDRTIRMVSVERRRARTVGFARLRQGAFRHPGIRQRAAREDHGLLQSG